MLPCRRKFKSAGCGSMAFEPADEGGVKPILTLEAPPFKAG
ncbi:MAG: hypothetical protein V6S10_05175 [Candidatus Methanoglobus sp.]